MLTSSPFDTAAPVSENAIFSAPSMSPADFSSPASCDVAKRAWNSQWMAPPRPKTHDESALAEVLRHPGVWRRGTARIGNIDTQATGLAELDALLPGGGWPRGSLSEILIEQDGLGECSLLLPAVAALTQARRRVALIAPPYIPYAPALVAAGVDLSQIVHIDASGPDTHWSAEQCLRAGCCGAVLNWLPNADYRQLRRLQLAAETGAAIGFVFRPLSTASQASPATLRLRVTASADGARIEILKCRGRIGGSAARLIA